MCQEISISICLDMLSIKSLDLNVVLMSVSTVELKSCSLCVELYWSQLVSTCSRSWVSIRVRLNSWDKKLLSMCQQISISICLDMLEIKSLDLNVVLMSVSTVELKSCSLRVELYWSQLVSTCSWSWISIRVSLNSRLKKLLSTCQ